MVNSVNEYIEQFTVNQQIKLNELRKIILDAAPYATESISYKMPAYKLNGKPLVYFAGQSKHIGLYPTPSAINEFKCDIVGFKQTGKGTLQIPYDVPLPVQLIKQIIEYKIKEIKKNIKGIKIMYKEMKTYLAKELQDLETQKLYKHERIIESVQSAEIIVKGKKVLNFCANNYLGLSSHPELIKASHEAIDKRGYGLSSVRFICGTQDIHKELERKLSEFLGMDDTILFSSCFDANGGVFEPLFTTEDAIITDALNHASIIDGVRLSKAQRWVYKHSDMRDIEEKDPATGKIAKGLEKCLKEAQNCRFRIIVTDGVFSMDGDIAELNDICNLAEKYNALVLVDDSHATGFMGKTGRGTHEFKNVMGKIDIITTTFGKALGGASGGCVSGHKEIIDYLRNKARPYLFSNTVPPSVVGATMKSLEILTKSTELRDKLESNTTKFRKEMTNAGFDIIYGEHPITPIMFGKYDNCSELAVKFADMMLEEGIYVTPFSFPVVPRGKDRIRTQISAGHSIEHLDKAITAFIKIGKELKMI